MRNPGTAFPGFVLFICHALSNNNERATSRTPQFFVSPYLPFFQEKPIFAAKNAILCLAKFFISAHNTEIPVPLVCLLDHQHASHGGATAQRTCNPLPPHTDARMPYHAPVAKKARFSRPRPLPRVPLSGALLLAAAVAACSHAPSPKPHTTPAANNAADAATPPAPVLWTLHSARRQSSFVRLDLPVVVSGMHITFSAPTGPASWINGPTQNFALYTTRIARGEIAGPAVEQLTGFLPTSSDSGSYLVKLPIENPTAPADADKTYTVTNPFPLYLQIDVSPLQDPGDYLVPISIAIPNHPVEHASLAIHIADVSLPADPRVLAVATSTTADLVRLLPDSFSKLNPIYLDRTDTDATLAVQQLDALVRAAERKGIALFVEDITPRVRVDEVGRVTLDWNAYDRLVQPYMDGSAFDDRIPLAVWLAPLPPRRISDSPTQLRQYIAACAQHFTEKGWTATPAFLHPALVDRDADAQLRDDIAQTLRLHMTRDFLAVTIPSAKVPQPRLWTVDDSDPRLPPAGSLATEQSLRAWPWVCAARSAASGNSQQVRGFLWRNAIERSDLLANTPPTQSLNPNRPLFILDPPSRANPAALSISPSLRLVWLSEGLNDTAMVGLLEQRAEPRVLNELFAGIVGRTGVTAPRLNSPDLPLPDPGYLYAGWPADRAVWETVPELLEKLLAAGTPGQSSADTANDPAFLAAQVWLAKSRRPVARIAGYQFTIKPGRDGDALLITPHLLAENPVDASVAMDARFTLLPGDLDLLNENSAPNARPDRRSFDASPLGIADVPITLAGFVDAFDRVPSANSTLELTERHNGATLQLPVQIPVYRARGTASPITINAHANEWPADTTIPAFGPMRIATRYLSRTDLSTGTLRNDPQPAFARFTYDDHFLYALIQCPQPLISDERNNDWPTSLGRWWGTDGIQLQLADASSPFPAIIYHLAFKPGGAMLARTLRFAPNKPLQFSDTLPDTGGTVKYAIAPEKSDGKVLGYTLELAIPRAWFPSSPGSAPAWRINILRHRADTLTSTSWSGPLVSDEDISQMGLLIGEK